MNRWELLWLVIGVLALAYAFIWPRIGLPGKRGEGSGA